MIQLEFFQSRRRGRTGNCLKKSSLSLFGKGNLIPAAHHISSQRPLHPSHTSSACWWLCEHRNAAGASKTTPLTLSTIASNENLPQASTQLSSSSRNCCPLHLFPRSVVILFFAAISSDFRSSTKIQIRRWSNAIWKGGAWAVDYWLGSSVRRGMGGTTLTRL